MNEFRKLPIDEISDDGPEEEKERNEQACQAIGYFDIVQRVKCIKITQSLAAMLFRFVDTALDARKALALYQDEQFILSGLVGCFVLLCPLAQFVYVCRKKGLLRAAKYLIPGGFAHLLEEYRQVKFLCMLPQSALYQNIPEFAGLAATNQVMAGIECFTESLPQAIIQSLALKATGGEFLDWTSVVFSIMGAVMGILLALAAMLKRHRLGARGNVSMSEGDAMTLRYIPGGVAPKTWHALAWILQHRTDLHICDLRSSGAKDFFVLEVAFYCPALQELNLSDCDGITDIAVTDVAHRCPLLMTMRLANCSNVTDEAIVEVAHHCPKLFNLDVRGCPKVTDDSIMEVAQHCPELEALSVSRCPHVTDTAVKVLMQKCAKLRFLWVGSCGVTENGDAMQDLSRRLPECKISFS
mmetsp:Transcript_122494/g.236221  ORF Transcript_122494/g.236221 Transcript_122494/m.236221 type:complete len:412 (-) Transcript_122494:174-1409(-)